MTYRDLYPYKNRALGLSTVIVPKDYVTNPVIIAQIAISNMVAGETFTFGNETIEICLINEHELRYKSPLSMAGKTTILDATDIADSQLATMVANCLRKSYPGYTDPICELVERDPAIFRLQTNLGWVVNDGLCLTSGNIRYTSLKDVSETVTDIDGCTDNDFSNNCFNSSSKEDVFQGSLF